MMLSENEKWKSKHPTILEFQKYYVEHLKYFTTITARPFKPNLIAFKMLKMYLTKIKQNYTSIFYSLHMFDKSIEVQLNDVSNRLIFLTKKKTDYKTVINESSETWLNLYIYVRF